MKKFGVAMTAMLLAVSMTACASNPSDSGEQKLRIGIIQPAEHAALDSAREGFVDALADHGYVDGETIEIDYQNAQGDSSALLTISQRFVGDDCDLVLAIGTGAAQSIASQTSEIPVLITAVTDPVDAVLVQSNEAPGTNVTGTNDLAPLDQQAQIIADLFPDVKQVGILYCSAEVNSVYQAEHIATYLDDLNIKHKDFSFSDSNDLQAVTNNCVSECDLIYVQKYNVESINQSINDPVDRPEESQCTGCGLASLSIDFYDIGYRAGEQAYDILVNGKNPAEMPVEDPQSLTRIYNPQIASDLGITLGDDYQAIEQ